MISVSTGQIPYETMLDYIFKAVTRFSDEYQIVAPVRKYTHRATRFFVIFSFTMFVHKLRETTSVPYPKPPFKSKHKNDRAKVMLWCLIVY